MTFRLWRCFWCSRMDKHYPYLFGFPRWTSISLSFWFSRLDKHYPYLFGFPGCPVPWWGVGRSRDDWTWQDQVFPFLYHQNNYEMTSNIQFLPKIKTPNIQFERFLPREGEAEERSRWEGAGGRWAFSIMVDMSSSIKVDMNWIGETELFYNGWYELDRGKWAFL